MGSRSFKPRCDAQHRTTSSVTELPNSSPAGGHWFVGSSEFAGYCSFTKAIEHMSERWILLIVREFGAFGPIGFNDWSLVYPAASRDRFSPSAFGGWKSWARVARGTVTGRTRPIA